MGAPFGNHNSKNQGRRSAYQEQADAKMLARMFFERFDTNEIKQILREGKYSIKEAFIAKALSGSDKHQIAVFNKLFPDQLKADVEGEIIVPIIIKRGNPADKK